MPKYDYRCGAGHLYEKREGFDAPAVQSCEVCGTEARRVLTPPAIVFKGSGWYVTDSRKSESSSSPAPASSSDSSSSTATETRAETKTETKASESKPSETKASAGSMAAD